MAMIPEGYGAVPGRKRETAIRLLKASDEVLHDEGRSVIATSDGYHVPMDVLDKYEAMLSDDDVAIDTPVVPDPMSLDAPHTNWTPFAPRSVADEHERVPKAAKKAKGEPAGNAAGKAWLNFAKKQENWDPADEELGRDDLRAKYGSAE